MYAGLDRRYGNIGTDQAGREADHTTVRAYIFTYTIWNCGDVTDLFRR